MADEALSTIVITRVRSALNTLRAYGVVLDGRKIDTLEAGATKRYGLPPGKHEIGVAMDFYKSPPLMLNLREGETVTLECGEKASISGRGDISMRALGGVLRSSFSPSDYFYLRVVGTAESGDSAPVPAVPAAEAAPPASRGDSAAPTIFLSYRRDDTEHITGRIRDRLGSHFGEHAIFRDVDSIPPGIDFVRKVEEAIRAARVLVAVIGPQWVEAIDRQGRRRLEQPDDPVRFELETAFSAGVPIVPVLVKQAAMPAREDLPASLAVLPPINAVMIPPEPYFSDGVKRLAAAIDGLLRPDAPAAAPTPQVCTACGHRIKPGQVFCTRCGQRM